MPKDAEPLVRLTLRLIWSPPEPLSVLVRHLIKVALRRFGLRCVKVEWLAIPSSNVRHREISYELQRVLKRLTALDFLVVFAVCRPDLA